MRKWVLPLVLLAVVLCAHGMVLCAHAVASAEGLTLSDAALQGGDEISLYTSATGSYLFLPAFADAAKLDITLNGVDSITVGGAVLRSGDITDAFVPGRTTEVIAGDMPHSVQVMQSQSIPAVFLRTASGGTAYIHQGKEYEEAGELLLVDQHGAVAYDGALSQIRIRGNSTVRYEKKAYQIKLADSTALLGMDKSKTWVLLANYIDHSLLRNTIALALAAAAGLAYTPQSTPVDVYINGAYMGNYLLCEKVSVDADRVDIVDLEKLTERANDGPLESYPAIGSMGSDRDGAGSYGQGYGRQPAPNSWKALDIPNNPEDISGGYLVEVTLPRSWDAETAGFVTASGWPLVLKDPQNATVAQVRYIQDIFQQIDGALDSGDGWDALTERIDVDSWVRKYILEEIVGNYDGGTGSQFFYKDADSRDPLVYCGPAWDYDNILGVNITVGEPEGFYVNARREQPHAVFPRLYDMPEFREAVQAVYKDVFRELLAALLGWVEDDSGQTPASIADYAEVIRASAEMNFVRWPIDYAYHQRVQNTGDTFAQNVDFLLDFLERRMRFLDGEWLQ